jgi:hypothetical protein
MVVPVGMRADAMNRKPNAGTKNWHIEGRNALSRVSYV